MKQSLVMTLIGKDRLGLVEALSATIEEHGGNWEESRMVQLGGEFAGLVRVEVPSERIRDLEAALNTVEGLAVVVARASLENTASLESTVEPSHFFQLEIVGQDHPGIVHRLAQAVAARRINVEELETGVTSAPMSGEQLFQARARLRAPQGLSQEELAEDLERLAADLMVDIRLEDPDAG